MAGNHSRPAPEAGRLAPYAGRWVAYQGGQILAQGGTPEQALLAARASRYKESIRVEYVPTELPLQFSEMLERVRAALPQDRRIYLVGGAVRDALRAKPTHDLDFVLSGEVLAVGRRVADGLGGAYYPLDEARDTARVILTQEDGGRFVLDFAALRGPDLESDLRARDFTVNAMAVALDEPQALLDPLGGAGDLRQGLLRACAPGAFENDPLRILRGVRLAASLGFHIHPDTRRRMRQAAGLLPRVSAERLRDELFRILDGPQVGAALRALDLLGALLYTLPELEALKGVQQTAPHVADVWNHTLDVTQKLGDVLGVLALEYDQEAAANLAMGLVSVLLGRYREQIHAHLSGRLNPDRSHASLLRLAALYHDNAKPQTARTDENGRIRFFGHDEQGAEIVKLRAARLRLSNDEAERLNVIVRHHMRPMLLAQSGETPSARAIYRFFRDTGPAGVDICLLSLADVLGTYGPALPQEVWSRHVGVVRALLEAWWERPEEHVSPPALVNGRDLMEIFDLQPGPQIGKLLEGIREAQATGHVKDRPQALDYARNLLHNH